MKLALLLAAVDARIGGVMVFGDRGTGKSTAVRALAALLPPVPASQAGFQSSELPPPAPKAMVPVPFVDLPLGATEDRVVGALDLMMTGNCCQSIDASKLTARSFWRVGDG